MSETHRAVLEEFAVAFGLDSPFEIECHDRIGSTNDRGRELTESGAADGRRGQRTLFRLVRKKSRYSDSCSIESDQSNVEQALRGAAH